METKSPLCSATKKLAYASIECCSRSMQVAFFFCLAASCMHSASYSYVLYILYCPCTSNAGSIVLFTPSQSMLHTCLKQGSQARQDLASLKCVRLLWSAHARWHKFYMHDVLATYFMYLITNHSKLVYDMIKEMGKSCSSLQSQWGSCHLQLIN